MKKKKPHPKANNGAFGRHVERGFQRLQWYDNLPKPIHDAMKRDFEKSQSAIPPIEIDAPCQQP